MIFEYNGKTYNTARSTGENSTNRLQVTDDDELKLAVINAYFQDDSIELLTNNDVDVLFNLALISARYSDLIEGLGVDMKPSPGLYPEWILNEVSRQEKFGRVDIATWARVDVAAAE